MCNSNIKAQLFARVTDLKRYRFQILFVILKKIKRINKFLLPLK